MKKSPVFRNFESKTKDVSGLNKAIKQQNELFRFSLDTEFCSILPKKNVEDKSQLMPLTCVLVSPVTHR